MRLRSSAESQADGHIVKRYWRAAIPEIIGAVLRVIAALRQRRFWHDIRMQPSIRNIGALYSGC